MKHKKLISKLTPSLSISKNDKYSLQNHSPIPNDGIFIQDIDCNDGFSNNNTVRYGEEVDVDDL